MAIEKVYVHPWIRCFFRIVPFFAPILFLLVMLAPGLAFQLGPFLVLPFFHLATAVILYSLAKIIYLLIKKRRQQITRYTIYIAMNVPYVALFFLDSRILFLMSQGLIGRRRPTTHCTGR